MRLSIVINAALTTAVFAACAPHPSSPPIREIAAKGDAGAQDAGQQVTGQPDAGQQVEGQPDAGSAVDVPVGTGCDAQVLIGLDANQLTRTEGTGETRVLFQAGDGLAADSVVINHWEMKGRYVSLVAFLYNPAGPNRYEYAILDVDGALLFHRIQTEPHNPTAFLSADGSLAVAGAQGFVARVDGSVTELGVFLPVAPVTPDGFVLVAQGDWWRPGVPRGWLHVGTLAFSAINTPEYPAFTSVGSSVIHIAARADSSLAVVISSPAATVEVPLDIAAPGSATVVSVVDDRFVLLNPSDGENLLRLDVTNARLEEVAGTSGGQWSYYFTATLAPGGDTLRTFTLDDGRMQQRRTSDLGGTWSDVGEPMTPGPEFGAGSHLLALVRGPRVLILSFYAGYGDYLNEVQFTPTAGGHHHTSVGGLYVNADVYPGAADLSWDGSCAATWVQRSGTVFDQDAVFELRLIDAETGTSRVLSSTSRVSLVRFGLGG